MQFMDSDLKERERVRLQQLHACCRTEPICSKNGNTDEIPINFDMPLSRMVEERDVRSVVFKTTGAEKQRFNVILAIMADVRKRLRGQVVHP